MITIATEHKAVLECCQYLAREGIELTVLPVQSDGLVDLDQLKAAIRADTLMISIAHVNNEIGVIQNIEAIGAITRPRGIIFHVDAAQSAGKTPIDVKTMQVDLMSFSAHKLYGPKGAGALYVCSEPRIHLAPLLHGGGQERGLRSGTLATHQIAGMGKAFELARVNLASEIER